MGLYNIELRRQAEQDIRKISPALITNILEKIESLAANLHPPQSLKLSGPETLYRLRVGDYRIIYEIDSETKTVIIHYVRHRKDAYRKF